MRYLILAAASGLAMAAAGCAERQTAPRTSLDCPAEVGELTRASVAADGKSCLYKTADADVTLELLPVTGDPEATLQGVETELKATQPADAATGATPASAPSAAAKADSATAHQADTAAKEATEDAKAAPSGKVDIHVGSNTVHVEGDEDNGEAHIDLPGIHVDTNNGKADVNVAGIHVNASDNGTDVHIMRDVRLRGEAFSRERRGVRATFTSYRQDAPDGNGFVGYEAAGPKTGPLAVAVVHGRSDLDRHGRLYRDLERLVRRNGDM